MHVTTIPIKTPVGKKLGLHFAPYPYCPLSLAFSRRPFLSAGLPSTGRPPHPSYRKMCEAQIALYIAWDEPWPDGGDERDPSRCTTPTPFPVISELPALVLVPGSPSRKSFRSTSPHRILSPMDLRPPWENNSQPHAYTPTPPCTRPSPSYHLHYALIRCESPPRKGEAQEKHRVKAKVGLRKGEGATAAVNEGASNRGAAAIGILRSVKR